MGLVVKSVPGDRAVLRSLRNAQAAQVFQVVYI